MSPNLVKWSFDHLVKVILIYHITSLCILQVGDYWARTVYRLHLGNDYIYGIGFAIGADGDFFPYTRQVCGNVVYLVVFQLLGFLSAIHIRSLMGWKFW